MITYKAMKNSVFCEIVRNKNYLVKYLDRSGMWNEKDYVNTNKLLFKDKLSINEFKNDF